ncbi:MAG TPA: hypothetical protein VJ598_02015 [Albitalea sp.]|nr:hypothetical protein [Albitalea sp.]
MSTPLRRACVTLLLLCATGVTIAAPPAEAAKNAGDACDKAVADTVRRIRGRDAQEVHFIGAKRAISPTPGDEIGVKGEGRYRGPAGTAAFTYSCAFNAETGGTSGVVFKEIGDARPSAEAAWQPDMSSISPEACETAAAASLKDKYPRVGRIAFDGETRQLRPAPNAHTSLEGRGAVERAPGMNTVPFSYRCEFAPNDSRVVSVQTSD